MNLNPRISYNTKIVGLLSFGLIGVAQFVGAQSNFINYTTDDGLPSNQVYGFHQDHNGAIWMATDRGLVRFNGRQFQIFNTEDGLPHSTVLKFFPQKNGTIWCATVSNELFYYHPDTMVFHPYRFNETLRALDGDQIRGLELADDGIRFRFVHSFGYFSVDGAGGVTKHNVSNRLVKRGKAVGYLIEEDGFYYLSNDHSLHSTYGPLDWVYRDLFFLAGDTLVRCTQFDLQFQFSDKTSKTITLSPKAATIIQDIGQYNDGYWVATLQQGVFLVDKSGRLVDQLLPELDATHFFADQQGGRWVASLTDGVFYAPHQHISLLHQTRNHNISSVSTGKDGHLMVGTEDFKFLQFKADLSLRSVDTTLFAVKHRYFPFNDEVIHNVEDSYEMVKSIANISDRLDTAGIYAILNRVQDSQGRYLYASNKRIYDAEYFKGGMLVAEGNEVNFQMQEEVLASYQADQITRDIDFDGQHIYCSTQGQGILVLDHDLSLSYQIDQGTGLSSNFINSTMLDGDTLWICTRAGLDKFYRVQNQQFVEHIDGNHGLAANEVNQVLLHGDTIFVGTSAGVNYFERSDWKKVQSFMESRESDRQKPW